MKVLATGATGKYAHHVVAALVAKGSMSGAWCTIRRSPLRPHPCRAVRRPASC